MILLHQVARYKKESEFSKICHNNESIYIYIYIDSRHFLEIETKTPTILLDLKTEEEMLLEYIV